MRTLPTRTGGMIRAQAPADGAHAAAVASRESPTVRPSGDAPIRIPLLKLLRFPAVRDRTGLSRSTIWRLERRGEFPKHYRIAPNVVAWVEEDVERWIHGRTQAVAS